jgi:hypothetical protein
VNAEVALPAGRVAAALDAAAGFGASPAFGAALARPIVTTGVAPTASYVNGLVAASILGPAFTDSAAAARTAARAIWFVRISTPLVWHSGRCDRRLDEAYRARHPEER